MNSSAGEQNAISLDGRRQRSEDSRRRIVQALLELVQEGVLEPSAETVAERAQVGLRSVFRHFKDMESLRQEVSNIIESRIAAVAVAPLAGDTWQERLDQLIERRADVFEQVMPYRRSGNVQRHRSTVVEDNNARLNQILRAILANILPDSLSRTEVEALDLVMCIDSWIRLRHDQKLTPDEAKAVMRLVVARLIAGK
jgi:AcrR family transcriptional regulator